MPRSSPRKSPSWASFTEPLVSMLYSSDEALQEAALLALRNLSVADDNKAKVVRQGGLPALVALLASGNVSIQEQAIVVLRNLSLDPENEVRMVEEGSVPAMVNLLR